MSRIDDKQKIRELFSEVQSICGKTPVPEGAEEIKVTEIWAEEFSGYTLKQLIDALYKIDGAKTNKGSVPTRKHFRIALAREKKDFVLREKPDVHSDLEVEFEDAQLWIKKYITSNQEWASGECVVYQPDLSYAFDEAIKEHMASHANLYHKYMEEDNSVKKNNRVAVFCQYADKDNLVAKHLKVLDTKRDEKKTYQEMYGEIKREKVTEKENTKDHF